MRRPFLLVPLLLVWFAIAPAQAGAGGFATAGLSSTPEGVEPGQPWKVEITVLQHGRTPLSDLTPQIRIQGDGAPRYFAAAPTGKPGVYRAEVTFPRAGRYEYSVLDGFNNEMPHTFPAIEIGDGAAVPAPSTSEAARRQPMARPLAETGSPPGEASASAPAPAPADDGGGIASVWLWGAGAALVLALAVLALDRRRRRPGEAGAPGSPEPA